MVNFSNIRPENIPNELKAIPHWILWGYREKDGNIIKVPIDPKTGAWINAHDPKNWLTFEEAIKYSKELKLGIGFDFTKDLGYVFIDMDHVYKNGIIEDPRIKSITENADTFIEISPSGEGLHLFFKCPKFDFGSTKIEGLPIEVYDKARFTTFTGMPFGELKPIREIEPEDLKKLLGMKSEQKTVKVIEGSGIFLDDSQRKDLTDLLEEHWDLDKPEADGNHHQHIETTAVYMKEAGVSKQEGQDFMIEFDINHPCADGKIHPIDDIKQIFDYVYDRNYSKTAPAGSVSKEFKRRLYRILNRNNKTSLEEKLKTLDEILATGPNDVYETLVLDYTFTDPITNREVIGIKTVEDPDSDKEGIYVYEKGVYKRGESILKRKAESFYRLKLEEAENIINEIEDEELSDRNKSIFEKLKSKFLHKKHQGVLTSIVSEALNMVRRNTYVSKDTMNPSTHIPYKNSYINLETWGQEPLNPSLFFTWQIQANYLDRDIDPKTDMPMFIAFLSKLIPVEKIPAFLTYNAYALLHPGFPVHKTLWLVGRQRIGKGASVRLLHKLNPYGHGTISIAKMLKEGLGFDISSIADKNFVTDAEVANVDKQKKENWAIYNGVFGGDDVDIEAKYKQKYTGRLHLKGIFIQNLPMIRIQNDATVERIIIVQTRDEPIKPDERIPNIEERIFEKEGDAIATYLLRLLRILSEMNFVFPEKITLNHDGEVIQWTEMDLDEKYTILENLSDAVEFFIEERTKHADNDFQDWNNEYVMTKDDGGKEVSVEEAYSKFKKWCSEKGIVPLNKQEFTRRFGKVFPKKRKRQDKKRVYVFTDVEFVDDQNETEDEKKLGQEPNGENPFKNRQSRTIECVSQLMDIKLIRPPQSEKEGNKDIAPMLGQDKNVLKIRTGLDFRYKEICPNLFLDVASSPKQEPGQTPDLNQKAIEYFNAVKDKLRFFRPPEERVVSREPDNVIRYLCYEEGLKEDDSKAIISKWQELGFVDVVNNQIVSKNRDQEVNENGNH